MKKLFLSEYFKRPPVRAIENKSSHEGPVHSLVDRSLGSDVNDSSSSLLKSENCVHRELIKSMSSNVDVPISESKKLTYFDKINAQDLSDSDWIRLLSDEFGKTYMENISKFLAGQVKKGCTIFPPREQIFAAFAITPFQQVRVVLIGQDPYHNTGQAEGLCFSVPRGQVPPPSLKNIYNELSQEYPEFKVPNHGCLISWAKQGVFLLNATLTVEAHKANSHSDIGWQRFTDRVIQLINSNSKSVVFLLWGGFAHKKEALINKTKHRIVKTAHPSPLSYAKFKGCKCFTKTNEMLKELGHNPIDWTLI